LNREKELAVGFLDKLKGAQVKKPKRTTRADRDKQVGADAYNAKRHDKRAGQLEAAGDTAGAAAERAAAENLRPGK
jgi:hypothetical protein